jgi:predicted Holliday junction resolvase-like endonuclease
MSTTAWLSLLAGLAIVGILYLVLRLRFERWKSRYAKDIRRDAVQRSQAVTVGKVYEQLLPYLPDFPWNPKEARFLGSPVDFIVFDGLDGGAVRAIVFVEVKTGAGSLPGRERLVRDAVLAGRVEWREVRLPDAQPARGKTSPGA